MVVVPLVKGNLKEVVKVEAVKEVVGKEGVRAKRLMLMVVVTR